MKQSSIDFIVGGMLGYIHEGHHPDVLELYEQSKSMHKEEILNSYCDGRMSIVNKEVIPAEDYYNKTFEQ